MVGCEMNASSATTIARRGRPAPASREDVCAAAMYRYLRGQRVDVRAITTELGLGRTNDLSLVRLRRRVDRGGPRPRGRASPGPARTAARGSDGRRLLETLDRFNRSVAEAPALRQFVEQERDAAARIITSDTGRVRLRIVAMIREMIEEEVRAGSYKPPVEPATLAYAIVRLGEAFLYNDAAGMRGDVECMREVEAALLGVPSPRTP
jgi:hypothetical protein